METCFVHLSDLWMHHTADEQARVLVWRIPVDADRVLDAFFASLSEPCEWDTPDLFMRFNTPFDTSFSYSHALQDQLLEEYEQSRSLMEDSGVAADWPFDQVTRYDSAAGFLTLLHSFAAHHADQFRRVAAVLTPGRVSSDDAWASWLDRALRMPIPHPIRIVLIDTDADPRWQALADRAPRAVKVIPAHIDVFDLMRKVAMQSGSGVGVVGAYRQITTDMMALLAKGTPAQVCERAAKAVEVAQREKWLDQQVVLQIVMAGAWLKGADYERALSCYREARSCATVAEGQGVPGAANLVMQSWFGEAGTLLAAGRPEEAALAHRSGAEQAARIPNAMFAVEGFRMAGFCYARAKQNEAAEAHYLLAIRHALAIPAAERPTTTLPIALQDLLRLNDTRRAKALEQTAQDYQSGVSTILAKAEKAAAALGDFPASADIARIIEEMHHRLEERFTGFLKEREHVIEKGDAFFRKVAATGRELLHPRWNGLPEVKHPLEKTKVEFPLLADKGTLAGMDTLVQRPAA